MKTSVAITIIFLTLSYSLFSKSHNYADSLKNIIEDHAIDAEAVTKELFLLSKYYHESENYADAIKYKVRELNIHKSAERDSSVARCNERLGVMFYHTGNYDVSADYLLKSLKYFEKNDNKIMLAQIKGNLANVYTRLENYNKSIIYLNESKEIFESYEVRDEKVLIGIYTNLALAYSGIQEYDSSRYYNKKALNILGDSDNSLYKASIFNNIGEIDFEEGLYDDAYKNYQIAFELFKSIESYNGMGTSLSNIAKIEIENENYQKAIELLKLSIEYFRKINALFFIVDASKKLSEAYIGLEDYYNALTELQTHIRLKDSLKGTETTEYIANLEMQYLAEKEEQKFQLLKKESEIKENKLQLSNLRFYITMVSIVLILVVTILIIVQLKSRLQKTRLKQKLMNQQQEQLKNDLFFKQKEMENFAVHIQEKNNLLQGLKKEIKDITTNSNVEKNALKNLTNLVSQSLYVDNNRKELELKIDQTHQEFIHRLKQQFPDLTKTEVRLCSLLLLELSTKDIAAVMNIEPASVKTSRNRLRKKLNLPPNSSLVDFLNKI